MNEDLAKITKNSNGFYTWSCSMDVGYYRKGMWMGIKACLGIAAFILVFGAIMAVQFHDWTNLLIVAGCDAVFLLITFVVFKLALSAEDPHESYEDMADPLYILTSIRQKRPSLRQNISNFRTGSRSSASLCRKRTTIL